MTRTYVRLLGPCFKTGRSVPLIQYHDKAGREDPGGGTDHRRLRVVTRDRHPRGTPCSASAPLFPLQMGRGIPDRSIRPSHPGLPPSTHSTPSSAHIDDRMEQSRAVRTHLGARFGPPVGRLDPTPGRTPLRSNRPPFFDMVKNVSFIAVSGTFNSLFRVLCIFPSRYLFAIGLPPGI